MANYAIVRYYGPSLSRQSLGVTLVTRPWRSPEVRSAAGHVSTIDMIACKHEDGRIYVLYLRDTGSRESHDIEVEWLEISP